MSAPIISFKNFSFQYNSQTEPTLRDINLDIYPGEKVLIAGPSGSGKSTLGRCLNGLIPQSYPGTVTGQAMIAGQTITESSIFALSQDVGTVLQDPDSQFVGLTVVEDMAFSLENDQQTQPAMRQATEQWAQTLDLQDLLTHRPQELSGGQKQRVAMAGVLIDNSKILLFDEPLASLDPASGKASMALIDQLTHTQDLTVIIIEHRIEDVLQQPIDQLIVMQDGAIVANDRPETILRQSLMTQLGLREPLYLSALKLAGVDLATCQHLDNLQALQVPDLTATLQNWTAGVQLQAPVVHDQPLLAIEHLTFGYDPAKPIINDVTVTLHQGEMISLVGQNGTGKSTLSNLITGFLMPQSGKMRFNGRSLADQSVKERADQIGYILQDPNQMISKTMIFDEVAAGLILRGVADDEVKRRVQAVLKVCGLYEFRHWPISALSFGQKKRVTIAAILVLEPAMLILDEPTAGQDLQHYTEMMTFLTKINQEQHMTIMLITHDMHLMLEYTDRTIVLGHGNILMDARPADVLTNAAIIQQASLAKTSLYTLAEAHHLNPTEFVAKFVQAEREAR
ncbi:ABC transporter ATP-binding protein [Lactiplantibacillus argentoratensis]|jgi:energy-coupling factor transport system ATP-binding protein|uniref:ATP-binding cassette domain-containing protein n=1 Tax=Lactiplantibacillus argentoratensis TaxID=271881 RepID=A0AAN1PYP5_9LACO|nr:ABC transporter ATP-binding protein [Lactiplantibacillus argentoratensis]KTF02165.1 Duplicated ATPase component MtsB of energizing module of methionine-regulated ECF transporter [Lactiplantibacillus plantarum]GEK62756.1 putative ABC transporter ATP-binding protein [Lactobacillus japonicus]AYJ34374.1 ATP-binding cassette domain-containing protein [Lactiplantibacillus argentoratensis]KRL99808.1 ABC superfamily ATP binding cassette transporter, ABC protein [Lactiplantibacillus argentoratensis D